MNASSTSLLPLHPSGQRSVTVGLGLLMPLHLGAAEEKVNADKTFSTCQQAVDEIIVKGEKDLKLYIKV